MNNTTEIEKKSCASCKFMELQHMQGQINRIMVCYRFPPSMSMIPQQTPQGVGLMGQTHHPVVSPHHWCHEYQKQEKPDASSIVVG